MMSYAQWYKAILDAASNISSKSFQEEAWFLRQSVVSSLDELYLTLMEDFTADLFFETYAARFRDDQIKAWQEFRAVLERYYDSVPAAADLRSIFRNPEWDLVRQSARKFVQAFERPAP